MFDNPEFDNHEGVHHFADGLSGLRAIIAVHSTVLGPAAGGVPKIIAHESHACIRAKEIRLCGMSRRRVGANLPTAASRPLRVAFVLAPRFTLTAFAGFIDALRLAADEGDRSRQIACEWLVLGDPAKPITASCGVQVHAQESLRAPRRFDYVVVVGGLLHGGQPVQPGTYRFLREAASSAVPIVALCTGSFILARAGLLEGYECCVSWFHREDFLSEFPRLSVQSNRLFVIDRDRLTCAGGTGVVQLAASIIERHFGASYAVKSLRILLEDAPLPSNAWQPESVVTRRARDSMVRQSMLLIEQNLAQPTPLTALLRPAGIGMRQIARRFLSDVGIGPREYRLRLRLERARWMLEHTDRTITQVGMECGFLDGSHFARTFRSRYGALPSSMGRARQAPGGRST